MNVGILGGTFDPIHYGHLRIAEEAHEQLGLHRVLLVPNRVSPFKEAGSVSSGQARLDMLRLAISDNPVFAINRIELERPGPSYTVDTVRALRNEYPEASLFFLTGRDAAVGLPDWREPDALLAMLDTFAVFARPGTSESDVHTALKDEWKPKMRFQEMPGLHISSTELRARVRTNRSIRYLLPPSVEEYIYEKGLYAGETVPAKDFRRE